MILVIPDNNRVLNWQALRKATLEVHDCLILRVDVYFRMYIQVHLISITT